MLPTNVIGMLKPFSETHAEVSCLAVHPSYRRGGRGETLLAVEKTITNLHLVLSFHFLAWIFEMQVSGAEGAAHGADAHIRFEYAYHAVVRGTVCKKKIMDRSI